MPKTALNVRVQAAIPGPPGDLSNRQRPVRKESRRPMQTQAPHGRRDGLAIHRLINPMPVIRRQARDLGKPSDIQRFVEMTVNMVEHESQACRISRAMTDIVHGNRRRRGDERHDSTR
jgi:hypothetical protein